MNNEVMFSTGKDDWETPDSLFGTLSADLGPFVLDAAANESNHKCDTWLGPGGVHEDALSVSWHQWLMVGNVWLNPPYSKKLQPAFVTKACAEVIDLAWDGVAHGKVVCLLPARTDTKLFHEWILPYGKVQFLKGRVKFKGASAGAPFPSMVVVFE